MGFDDLPTFPVRFTGPMFKGTKAEARAEREKGKQAVRDKEDRNKTAARKRDGYLCRFPRCSCHKRRTVPECAHLDGKGMGGDHGERSHSSNLICLCPARHKESRISLHRGTLRCVPLTIKGTNSKVRWEANIAVLDNPLTTKAEWVVLATETRPLFLEPLTKEQGALLERIAEMAS